MDLDSSPNHKSIIVQKTVDTAASSYRTTHVTHKLQWDDIVWRNVIIFLIMHISCVYSTYLIVTGNVQFRSWAIAYTYAWFGAFGVTVGSHRLWSHSAYKARLPMRIILMFLNSIAFQNSIYEWARDHRVHHKYTDTNADPHNYSRGFFFAHMGWLMVKKHPDVKEKGRNIDLTDLEQDGVVMFQKKYYLPLVLIFSFIVPTFGISMLTGDGLWHCFNVCGVLRYAVSLHQAWLINSGAHSWGFKPYDKSIKPTDNKMIATFTHGEGYHNYHHVFPWDYKTSEYGNYTSNYSSVFIDSCAKIGWAYDMKSVSAEMIAKRAVRTGDNTWQTNSTPSAIGNNDINDLEVDYDNLHYGWNDKALSAETKREATITNKLD